MYDQTTHITGTIIQETSFLQEKTTNITKLEIFATLDSLTRFWLVFEESKLAFFVLTKHHMMSF